MTLKDGFNLVNGMMENDKLDVVNMYDLVNYVGTWMRDKSILAEVFDIYIHGCEEFPNFVDLNMYKDGSGFVSDLVHMWELSNPLD